MLSVPAGQGMMSGWDEKLPGMAPPQDWLPTCEGAHCFQLRHLSEESGLPLQIGKHVGL